MRAKNLALAALLAGSAALMVGCSSAASAAATGNPVSIDGTWTVTVHPSNSQPSFESTITFTNAGGVVEATSKGPMSGGIGVWSRASNGHFTVMFRKYRFDATGAYVGSTVINEDDVVAAGGQSYDGQATTNLLSPSGAVVSSFTSTSHAVRMG
jgi:hypothetical protein